MLPLDPAKCLFEYDAGHITAMELGYRLVQAAAAYPVETLASLVPSEVLQGIRQEAASPPPSPLECPRFFVPGAWIGLYDHEAEERENRRLWYDGIWRWHDYFQSCQADVIRSEVQRLIRAIPFRRFALSMENGDRVVIEHPENIAFDPGSGNGVGGSEEFYVISNNLRLFSTFRAVTSVGLVDHGELTEWSSVEPCRQVANLSFANI